MKRFWYIVFIVVFFLMCIVPSVGLVLRGPGDPAANEVPAVLPKVKNYDGSWNAGYFTGLRDYVGKGFFLRLEGITAWDTLAAELAGTSEDDGVLLGRGDWLFDAVAADELSGAALMSDREIWCAARSLVLMDEYARSQGAQLLLAVTPGKYRLYPQYAPEYITVAEGRNLTRLQAVLDSQGVAWADLDGAFRSAGEELYWHGDVHWNGRGAALGADTILAALGRDGGFFAGEFSPAEPHMGDIYAMLYPLGTAREPDYIPARGFTFEITSNYHSPDDMVITTEKTDAAGSLLLFRDSFGRSLYPYMAESFRRAYFSRMNNYDLTLIGQIEADTVVIELVESTLRYLLRYPAVYPAPERDISVLDGADPIEASVTAEENAPAPEGLVKLTGTLPETAIEDCVYVKAGGAVYEAMPGEAAFTAYLPEGTALSDVTVYTG